MGKRGGDEELEGAVSLMVVVVVVGGGCLSDAL